MAFDPRDFLSYAHARLDPGNEEVLNRTIVGRAYYSAFLAAREKAKIKNTSGSIHEEVINHFKRNHSMVSNNLINLKILRSDADYKLEKSVGIQDAKTSCTRAYKIIEYLDGLA